MPDFRVGPVWVPGHPITKGSVSCKTPHQRGLRQNIQPDNPAMTLWEDKVAACVRWRSNHLPLPLDGPVELKVTFHFKRPARTAFKVAPYGRGPGDTDKLTRCVGDAIERSGVLVDDAHIVKILAEKIWSPTGEEGVSVELRPYEPHRVDREAMILNFIRERLASAREADEEVDERLRAWFGTCPHGRHFLSDCGDCPDGLAVVEDVK